MSKRSLSALRIATGVAIFWVAAAVALPASIGNRIVDGIMDFGDKHIKGPFKKGGGDEAATRKVLSDLIMRANPWKAAGDIFVGSESRTSTPTQDEPGYSQWHDNVLVP